MAMSVLSGGGNNALFWGIRANTGGTAYEIITMGSGSEVVVPSPTAALAEFVMNATLETKVDRDESGTIKVTLTQNGDTPELQTFLNNFAIPSSDSTGAVAEYTYEDGVTGGGTNATGRYVLAMIVGSVPANATNTSKRKVTIAIGSLAPTSGSFTQKSGETSNPTFEFNSIKALFSYDVVPAMFPTAYFQTPSENITIAKGDGGKITFMTKNQVV